MATTEELDVVIKTVADTTGAQQVAQSLQQTQRVGQQTQQQLTAGQQGSNAALRALMAQHGQTLESFQKASQTISQSMGVKPTLRPEDFGISPQIAQATSEQSQALEQTRHAFASATTTAAQHTEAQRELRGGLNLTSGEFARFTASAIGLGTGLSVASTAGHLVANALSGIVAMTIEADQSMRNLVATFGAAAANYQQFAETLSRSGGGFSVTDIQSAIEAVRPLAEQFNLTTRQVEGLVAAARELATIRAIPLSTALDALLGSLEGNAAAAAKLGLSMSDQQVAARAAGGAYRQTFDVLSDGEKVTLRYAEALRQVDAQQKNVAGSGPAVTTRVHELELQLSTLNTVLGQGPVSGFLEFLTAMGGRIAEATGKQKSLTQATQDWHTMVEAISKLTESPLPSLTPPPRVFGPAPLTGADLQGPQIISAANQALQQVRGAVGSLATATDAQLASLAQHEAEVMVLNAEMARGAIESAGLVTDALQVALQRATDPAEVARLQARLEAINRVATANQDVLAAQRVQNQLQYESVQLTGREAALRLEMLPSQERMLELQNQTNQAQLQAQQRALPSTRQLQDLQNAIEQQRLIAQSGFRSMEERQAALRAGAALGQQLPEAQLAASRAGAAALPAQRAAQDVGLAAQLQSLQQQAVLFGPEYQRQQLALLSQFATAVENFAQRKLDIAVQPISVNVTVDTGQFSDADLDRISDLVGTSVTRQFHDAVQSADRRSASTQLLGTAG